MTSCGRMVLWAVAAVIWTLGGGSWAGALETPMEQVNFEKWTKHARLVDFLSEVDKRSPLISKHLLGKSEQGREIFYLKISSGESFGRDENKLTVLIYGQKHGNEPSGNDAILQLLRDFAVGDHSAWLEHMDLLLVPQLNPDGAEVLERRNAANVDLNRSQLILDGKEVRHLRELFHRWEPEVALDVHEYQPWVRSWTRHGFIRLFDAQYGLPTNLNVPAAIRNLAENEFLDTITRHLENDGFPFHNYLVGNPDSIRYSTSNINDGRQGFAILGTFSLILEGRRDREDLGNIAHRTAAQVSAISGLLQFVADHRGEVADAVRESRQRIQEGKVNEFILTMGRARSGNPLRIPVREVRENADGDFEKGEVITVDLENYHPLVTAERRTSMPRGYLVPADEKEVIRLLRKHRVEYSHLAGGERFKVEQFVVDGFVEEVFEAATLIPTGSLKPGEHVAREGDVFIPTAQLRGLLVATALEAQSMHGLIQYAAFSHLKQEGGFPILRVVSDRRERASAPLDLTGAVAKVDELMGGWDRPDSPGGVIGVARDGRPLLVRAYGMADLEHSVPITPSTIFEAGSVSKQFVAAAVVLLALEGKLSLDDDVRGFLPELPDYGKPITLWQLVTHTSGLRDWGQVAAIAGLGRSDRSHTHDHVLDILSRQQALNFPPGERYSYSNSGYNLLAMVVDRVAGESFSDFSQNRLFKPLGMTHTQWRDDFRRVVPGRSSAYTGREGGATFRINRPIENVHGNGGLLTTVGDLLKWNHALSTDYFGGAFRQKMLRQGVLNNGRPVGYAGGLRLDQDHGQPVVHHRGATSGYRAFLSYFPQERLSVALLFNVTGVSADTLGSRIAGIFLEHAAEPFAARPDTRPAVELDERVLKERVGLYIDPRHHRVTELTMERGRLMVRGQGRLIPLSENEFRLAGSERIWKFVESEDGERLAIQLYAAGGYAENRLEPVEGARPWSEDDLRVLTGRYESREAQVTLTIAQNDGGLVVRRGHNDEARLEPIYQDAFDAGRFGLLRFFRDEDGQVTEFACSLGRVYDLRFYRQ